MSQSSMHCQQSSAHGGWTTGQQPPAAVCMVNPGTPVSPDDEAGTPPGCRASSGLGSSRTSEQGISMRGYLEDGRGRSLGSVPSCGRLAGPENAGAASSKLSNRFWNSTDSSSCLCQCGLIELPCQCGLIIVNQVNDKGRHVANLVTVAVAVIILLLQGKVIKLVLRRIASGSMIARPAKRLAFHHYPSMGHGGM